MPSADGCQGFSGFFCSNDISLKTIGYYTIRRKSIKNPAKEPIILWERRFTTSSAAEGAGKPPKRRLGGCDGGSLNQTERARKLPFARGKNALSDAAGMA